MDKILPRLTHEQLRKRLVSRYTWIIIIFKDLSNIDYIDAIKMLINSEYVQNAEIETTGYWYYPQYWAYDWICRENGIKSEKGKEIYNCEKFDNIRKAIHIIFMLKDEKRIPPLDTHETFIREKVYDSLLESKDPTTELAKKILMQAESIHFDTLEEWKEENNAIWDSIKNFES